MFIVSCLLQSCHPFSFNLITYSLAVSCKHSVCRLRLFPFMHMKKKHDGALSAVTALSCIHYINRSFACFFVSVAYTKSIWVRSLRAHCINEIFSITAISGVVKIFEML